MIDLVQQSRSASVSSREEAFRLRLRCFPGGWHPYQALFARSMATRGIEVAPGGEMSDRLLVEQGRAIDAIHFHWLEHLWQAASLPRRLRLIAGLDRYCRLAKRLGKRIVWTVHNHANHEGARWGDHLGFRMVAGHSDLVIAHSRWSRDYLHDRFGVGDKTVVMPIGNYDGFYEARRDAAEVRASFGLDPNRPTCGLIGMVRANRGHELAIETVARMRGEVQLLIVGPSVDPNYEAKVRSLAAACPHVTFHAATIRDEYADLIRACDVILLPYSDITGSAALLATWTEARAVVLSDLPYFREFQPDDEAAGVMLEELTSGPLADGIRRLLNFPESRRTEAARREADKYPWGRVIEPVVGAIADWGVAG